METLEKQKRINPFLFPGETKEESGEDTVGRNDYPRKVDHEYPELRKIGIEVAGYYNMKLWQIHQKTKTRKREIVQTRQVAMFFSRIFTKYSLATIGNYFSGKDHSTVLYASKTINNLIETDRQLRDDIHVLYRLLKKDLDKDEFGHPYYINNRPENYEVQVVLGKNFTYSDYKNLSSDLEKMELTDQHSIIIL
jgi:hypothetical protein